MSPCHIFQVSGRLTPTFWFPPHLVILFYLLKRGLENMKNSKNQKSLENDLVKNSDDWVSALRQNLYMLLNEPGVTLRSLSEIAGVNYDTLKSFIYGNSKNCKVGPLINICKAFNISLDGLCGANTISDQERQLVLNYRKLPPAIAYYYRWSLDNMVANTNAEFSSHDVPFIKPMIWSDGTLHISSDVGVYNVTGLSANLTAKIKVAMSVPCDYYMPYYSPHHVIFIANDRESLRGEHSVVVIAREMIITEIKDGGCYSIRDGGFRCPLSAVDQIIGYIAGTCLLDEPML